MKPEKETKKDKNKEELSDIISVVMVIVVENGHGDTSSNPGRAWLHLTYL